MATLQECLAVFPEEEYPHPYVKALEKQRRLFTANLGVDMGEDWFGPKGNAFRRKSLVYYVRMFLQATMIRQFRMGAEQVKGMIKNADETSGMASLDPVQMLEREAEEVEELTKRRLPAVYMEQMREQAKTRRDKARRILRGRSITTVFTDEAPLSSSGYQLHEERGSEPDLSEGRSK